VSNILNPIQAFYRRAIDRDELAYNPAERIDRWDFTGRRARQLMRAAEIGTVVPVNNEAQARELDRLGRDGELIRAVWERAEGLAKEQDKRVTAAIIREVGIARNREVAAAADRAAAEACFGTNPFAMSPSPRGTYRGGNRPLSPARIPAALAASERSKAESDAIRAKAGLEPVPESATVAAWRQALNGNGGPPTPSLAKVIAELKKLRDALPASARDDLDEAITAVERADRRQKAAT
jgi:hypothetical protein